MELQFFMSPAVFEPVFLGDNYYNSALVKAKYGPSNFTETKNELRKDQMQTSVLFPKNALFLT